jgi:succinate-acetate transporter protein
MPESDTVVPLKKHESWTKGGPVVSHLDDDEISRLSERASATIGDPTTLGLWAFATGTWIFGTVIAGAFPQSTFAAVIPMLIAFGGIAQFIAGLYAFRRTNVLLSTAFCCFGAFNVTAGFFLALQTTNTIATGGPAVVMFGFLLESFAFIALALTIAALRTNMAMVVFLAALTIGYCLSGIPMLANATGPNGWTIISSIGGWFLVFSALCAYYTGMALVVNSTWNRTVLPIGGEP